MAVLDSILAWLAGWILNYLLGKAVAATKDAAADLKRDEERGVINEANVKAYNGATTRADRIRAATDLLNGVRRP